MFQVGDLVQYNTKNKWHGARATNPKKDGLGVITEIVQAGNRSTIHVHWSDGDKIAIVKVAHYLICGWRRCSGTTLYGTNPPARNPLSITNKGKSSRPLL